MVPPPQTGGSSGVTCQGDTARTDHDTGERADISWIMIGHVVQEIM